MLRDGGPAHSCSALQEALDLRLIRSYVFDMNGIFHTPKRFSLLLLAAFALANGPVWAAPTPVADKGGDKKEEAVWGEMPAGAKTTYIGDTRGNDWYVEFEAMTQAGYVPAMLQNAEGNPF